MIRHLALPALLLFVLHTSPSKAEQPTQAPRAGQAAGDDSLRIEVERLRKRLDETEARPKRAAVVLPQAVGCPEGSTRGACDLDARARGACMVIGYPKARRIHQVDVPSAEAPLTRDLYDVACFD